MEVEGSPYLPTGNITSDNEELSLADVEEQSLAGVQEEGSTVRTTLTSFGFLVHYAAKITSLSFELAKTNTKIGFGIAKELVSTIPVAGSIASPLLSASEFIALMSIEVGRFWTDFGFGTAEYTMETLNLLFGSSDTAKAIIEFATLVKQQNLFVIEDGEDVQMLGYTDILRGLTAWVLLQRQTHMGLPAFIGTELPSNSPVKNDLKKYINFSMGAYGHHVVSFLGSKMPFTSTSSWFSSREHISFAEHNNIPLESITHSSHSQWNDNSQYHPRFYVVIDNESKNVVIVLRGTLSLHDLMVDLTCKYDEFFDDDRSDDVYLIHSGMHKVAATMLDPDHPAGVFNSVKQSLLGNEGFGLILTGHSLGAGIAMALTLILADLNTGMISCNSGLPSDRKIHCFAFAPPCLVSRELSILSRKVITSAIIEYDSICCLSLGSVLDLGLASKWMHKNKAVAGKIIQNGFFASSTKDNEKGGEEKEVLSEYIKIVREKCFTNKKMYPAGMLIFISGVGIDEELKMEIVADGMIEELFSELQFNSRMLSNHMPNFYQKVIQNIK